MGTVTEMAQPQPRRSLPNFGMHPRRRPPVFGAGFRQPANGANRESSNPQVSGISGEKQTLSTRLTHVQSYAGRGPWQNFRTGRFFAPVDLMAGRFRLTERQRKQLLQRVAKYMEKSKTCGHITISGDKIVTHPIDPGGKPGDECVNESDERVEDQSLSEHGAEENEQSGSESNTGDSHKEDNKANLMNEISVNCEPCAITKHHSDTLMDSERVFSSRLVTQIDLPNETKAKENANIGDRSSHDILERSGNQTVRSCPSRLDDDVSESSRCESPMDSRRIRSRAGHRKEKHMVRKISVFSRMSQEAQHAITETRKEMGLAKEVSTLEPHAQSVSGFETDGKSESNIAQITQNNAQCDRDTGSKEAECLADHAKGLQIGQEGNRFPDGYTLHEFQRSGQTTPLARQIIKHHNSTNETQISFECYQNYQEDIDTLNPDALRNPKSAKLGKPRTKLPNIYSSFTNIPPSPGDTSNNDSKTIQHNIPGVGNYKVLPLGLCKHNKEKTFEITPLGYDSRYKDLTKRAVEGLDETPADIKARAVQKCSNWLSKYM